MGVAMNNLNGTLLKEMLQSGAANLANHQADIDALNVFPVPDGDTGTNMSMTFTSGVNDVMSSGQDELTMVAKTLSRGLLMGARGNSGVILSQIFRGFYQSLEGKTTATTSDLAQAFVTGSRVAYKAVMRPVEGTILTVIREAADMANIYVQNNPNCSLLEFSQVFVKEAQNTLQFTPELLPVLKEVGVVDSGGAGLCLILEGFSAALEGKPFTMSNEVGQQKIMVGHDGEHDQFGYCTEFIIRLSEPWVQTFNEDKLKRSLDQLGDSIVVVQDEDIVKVHVHTVTPGDALNLCQRFGEFVKLKIENMQEQHDHIMKMEPTAKKEKYALIAVSAGDGLEKLFKEYRVTTVISGGQTMNPSTEDFVSAIKKCNAEHIIILPNNSNIVLAAIQAKDVMDSDHIHVIETKSIPQGLLACIMFNPEVEIDENISEMTEAISRVKTGQITYAIKDTMFEGMEIVAGDYMGIFEKNIVATSRNKIDATKNLLKAMVTDSSEIITFLVGEGVSEEEVSEMTNFMTDNFSVDVDVQYGNQPVYSFIIGVE